MNEFERFRINDWVKIIEAFEDTGKVYSYEQDFPKDYFGTFGFFIDNPDRIETTYTMKRDIVLSDFLRQCERLLKHSDLLSENDKLNSDSSERSEIVSFGQLFKNYDDYDYVMSLLARYEYVDENTKLWKDHTKGNKSFMVALMKHLHQKGYYRDDKLPSNSQIIAICESSFGWNVSIDTVKKTKPDSHDFSFIPPSNSK
ncbi:MAG TPA: hypothetical protein P5248_00145 [Bacteroidales bacterium]|nr:hypothetical protein [Bacteroidales bacterium]